MISQRSRLSVSLAVLLSALHSITAVAAPATPQDEAIQRLQEEENRRLERRLDDAWLPGDRRSPSKQADEGPDDGPCFQVKKITLRSVTGESSPLQAKLQKYLHSKAGQCLSLAEIKSLQRQLSNRLLDQGYITSRILMPEQSLADGSLELMLLAGRLEVIESESLSSSLVAAALPGGSDDIIRLPAMEQAVENLNRLPGLEASLDIEPGSKTGRSVIVAESRNTAPLQGALLLNEKYYGSTAHGTARASLETVSPLSVPDRFVFSLNTDLDQEKSDRAWGAGFDYDLGLGYWLLGAGFNRQAYKNCIDGVFQSFQADGYTDITRLEASRVLFRSGLSRLTAGLLGRYTEVENRLAGETIQVSSYRLGAAGMRLDFTQRWNRWELGSILTWESGDADGPATDLPGDARVADASWERTTLYFSLLRPFKWRNSSVQLRANHQYSADQLFPVDRLSLTARVKGFERQAFSGNTGSTGTLETAMVQPLGRGSIRPYAQWQYGVIHSHRAEHHYFRLSSATAGLVLNYPRFSLTLENTWPMEQFSTEDSRDDYVAHAAIQFSY
jgi:hemolysin activation/secretion protein